MLSPPSFPSNVIRKKEQGRRKKEEGRGKFGNELGREFNGYKSEFRGLNQGKFCPLSILPTLHSALLRLSHLLCFKGQDTAYSGSHKSEVCFYARCPMPDARC
ncbi:hypothetical protein, partial [Microcoleus sp. herbarium8]|uniref:hypothetical protein n=1 Tax=Microcoleus sp. herbarium8 TaxID=3055436 RepID=UPI002FD76E7E